MPGLPHLYQEGKGGVYPGEGAESGEEAPQLGGRLAFTTSGRAALQRIPKRKGHTREGTPVYQEGVVDPDRSSWAGGAKEVVSGFGHGWCLNLDTVMLSQVSTTSFLPITNIPLQIPTCA